jgi:hypothetical protein
MPFRIPSRGGVAMSVVAASLLVAPAAASGAVPVKKGVYRGATSQSRTVELRMTRSVRRLDSLIGDLRTSCGRVGRVTLFAGTFDLRVSPGGRFRGTDFDSDLADIGPFFENGRRHNLFDVTRYDFSGRFVSRRRARGQYRARSLLLDRDSFTNEGALDRCDTGLVSWSARLRRR